MKIDREQIEQMAQAMCGYCTENKRCVLKYSAPCSEVASQDCTFKESAEELICKGYGKISEYKAEIERLNSNNGFLQCVISHSKDMMDEAVKEAQIDVLNKIKNCREATDSDCYPYLERIVNKLIEEVEYDKCNC